MKRKTLTLTLSILACLALIGVGFASWIISANTSTKAEGSFIVDTVSDKSYTVTGDWKDKKSEIIFSAPTGDTKNGWLTNDSAKKENLTVTYQITVKYGDGTAATGLVSGDSSKLTAVVTAPNSANYKAAVNAKLITENPTITVEEEGSTGVYNITVTYKWGEHFANAEGINQNPYVYYNAKQPSDVLIEGTTYLEDAKSSLKTLAAIESSVKFTLTINIVK